VIVAVRKATKAMEEAGVDKKVGVATLLNFTKMMKTIVTSRIKNSLIGQEKNIEIG